LAVLSQVSYSKCPVKAVLLLLSLLGGPVATVLSLTSRGCLVLSFCPVILSRLSFLSFCSVFALRSQLSGRGRPVPAVLTRLSCPGCPVLAFLLRRFCPQLSCHDVMSQPFCPPCHVQGCSVPKVHQYQYTCTKNSVLYRYKCMFFFKH
jgi:hypothetical protein